MSAQLRGFTNVSGVGGSVAVPDPGSGGDTVLAIGVFFYASGAHTVSVSSGWTVLGQFTHGYHHWFAVAGPSGTSCTVSRASANQYMLTSTAWYNTTGGVVAYHAAANTHSEDRAQVTIGSVPTDAVVLTGFIANGTLFDSITGTTGTVTNFGSMTLEDSAIGGAEGPPFYFERWWDLAMTVQAEAGTVSAGTRIAHTDFDWTLYDPTNDGAYGSGVALVIYGLPDPDNECFEDTFTRVVSGDVGTADNGDSYDTSGAIPEVFSVDGARLQFDPGGDGTQWVRYEREIPTDAVVRMQFIPNSIVASGGGDVQAFGIATRWQAGGQAYVAIANVGPDYRDLTLYRAAPYSLFFSPLATVAIPAAVAGQTYTLTLADEGTSPTLLTATWRSASGGVLATVSTTNSFAALQAPGKPGWGFDFQGDADALTAQGDNFAAGSCPLVIVIGGSGAGLAWII
jgi:hypothetical protein